MISLQQDCGWEDDQLLFLRIYFCPFSGGDKSITTAPTDLFNANLFVNFLCFKILFELDTTNQANHTIVKSCKTSNQFA